MAKTKNKRVILLPTILLLGGLVLGTGKPKSQLKKQLVTAAPIKNPDKNFLLYDSLKLYTLGLSKEAFKQAITGYESLNAAGKIQRDNILTIIDFSLPSNQKRLFVLDLLTGKLLFNTFVSHGRNSGAKLATKFSNAFNSLKSCLGFFTTGEIYAGKHGSSLRLEGQEAGINNNAYNRGIVIHGANYVNEKLAYKSGSIGRSFGCPAIPEALRKPIIETIRNGSCLFVYSPNQFYSLHSKLLNTNA